METTQKSCSECKIEKPLTEYYKVNAYSNRYRPYCKECKKGHQKKYAKSN